ncbi:phytanoyl-CoA-dioxygenase-like protein [Bisporella sp. PMI_857]|nr:phytanoyl-CoA-dioxygenase-like protein [Bisporella sp. PMI_857]
MAPPAQANDPTQTSRGRVQLGKGTTFLPGKKDPLIQPLIDHVLEHGYVILPNIYTREQVDMANAELARLETLQSAGPAAQGGRNSFEGLNTKRIYALVDKSTAFYDFPIHDTVWKLNEYFLQPHFLMTSYHSVVIEPGEKEQLIHTDDGLIPLPRPRPLMGIGTMVALDDFTAENGATTLIPGSHLWDDERKPTREEMVKAIMPAGSMVYFLNTVWHSGGANIQNTRRRSLTVQYCQPWIRATENMTISMGWDNDLDQVPKRLLSLMGFSTHEFMGHIDGRAPRTGVEMRKKRLVEWAKGQEISNTGNSKL